MLLPSRPDARPPQRFRAGAIGRVVTALFLHEVYLIFRPGELERVGKGAAIEAVGWVPMTGTCLNRAFCLTGGGCRWPPHRSFACLHDLEDPVGAARHVLQTMAPDRTWLIVEPFWGPDVALVHCRKHQRHIGIRL